MLTEITITSIIGAVLIIISLILLKLKKHEIFLVLLFIGIVVLGSALVVGTIPQCPDCGKRYDSSYCINCGTEMYPNTKVFCPICNEEINNKRAKFCPDCVTKTVEKDTKIKTEVVFSNE